MRGDIALERLCQLIINFACRRLYGCVLLAESLGSAGEASNFISCYKVETARHPRKWDFITKQVVRHLNWVQTRKKIHWQCAERINTSNCRVLDHCYHLLYSLLYAPASLGWNWRCFRPSVSGALFTSYFD